MLLAQNSETDHPFQFGLKVGIPVTDMFSASNTSMFNDALNVPGSIYNAAVPRYILGLSGEFKLPAHLRLEIDGLYKRAGYATSSLYEFSGNNAYYQTSANVWEVPALLKTNVTLGHVRPFIDFGASLRHISTIQTNTYLPVLPLGIITGNAPELHNRNSYGGVAGIGITFKIGSLELSPEARYTRWANQSFEAAGLRTNLDQGDVLLGITF